MCMSRHRLHCLFPNVEYGYEHIKHQKRCGCNSSVSSRIFWKKIVWQRLHQCSWCLLAKFTKVWTWLTSNNFQPWSSHIFWPATLAELWRWEHRWTNGFWSPREKKSETEAIYPRWYFTHAYLSEISSFFNRQIEQLPGTTALKCWRICNAVMSCFRAWRWTCAPVVLLA